MRRLVVLLVLAALVALSAGAVLVVRPDLEDRERAVDDRWQPLAEALEHRYEALGALAASVADATDPPRSVAGETTEILGAWDAARAEDAGTEAQVALANDLEGLASRLVAAVASSPRLAEDDSVVGARDALTATVAAAGIAEAYDAAVRDYDEARTSLTGQPVAALLGYEARTAFAPVRTAPG